MDLWVVAAAAGAGCIAKNLQNFSADKKESPRGPSLNVHTESRNFLQQLRDKTCPLRRLAQTRVEDDSLVDLGIDDRSNSREREAYGDYGIIEDYNLSTGVGVDGESMSLRKMKGGKWLARNTRCGIRALTSLGSCVDIMEQHTSCLYPALVTAQFDARLEETRTSPSSSSSSSSSLKQFEELMKANKGSSPSQAAETMLLFVTGMTVGILSATTSWRNEVDELNRQLKQMQSLVQDLHDELDLKDMVTVKELDDEVNLPPREKEDSPLSTEEPFSSPSLVKAGELDNKVENLELLSRIEAELQAELEMLELNMKVSDQDRIYSVVELDPDFEPEIVRGELKPAMVENATESESRTTDTTTDCSKPANYTVSPWELSLRLHELIESRLETRIKDLEIALLQSQNRVGIQNGIIVSTRRYSYSETESSSAHHSPTCICDEHDKREDVPSEKDRESGNGVGQGRRSTNGIQNGNYDSMKDMPQIWDKKQRFVSLDSNEDSMCEDEGSDESEMLLIKQIIERRKSGSGFNFEI